MEAKINLKSRLPSRHVTEGPERAPHRSYCYAMGLTDEQTHQPLVGVASCCNEAAPCDVAEVFKRTPSIADLKPGGRFVAKDLFEARDVPLLMKTLLDNGFLHGECLTVTGCSMAENLYRGSRRRRRVARQSHRSRRTDRSLARWRDDLHQRGRRKFRRTIK
jgi:dihydroxyacid dehydratase/phosphogluconate dehydratase